MNKEEMNPRPYVDHALNIASTIFTVPFAFLEMTLNKESGAAVVTASVEGYQETCSIFIKTTPDPDLMLYEVQVDGNAVLQEGDRFEPLEINNINAMFDLPTAKVELIGDEYIITADKDTLPR